MTTAAAAIPLAAVREAAAAFGLALPPGSAPGDGPSATSPAAPSAGQVGVQRLGQGLINDTYQVAAADGSAHVLQALNTQVFGDPAAVMANIDRVGAHLAARASAGMHTLRPRPASGGELLHRDGAGRHWRCYPAVLPSRCLQQLTDADTAARAGEAFGRFLHDLSDLPGPSLAEVLPGFHDTAARVSAFDSALQADPLGRAGTLAAALPQVAHWREPLLAEAGRRQPTRVVHNDTKLNNLLFAVDGPEVICVLDLDTVMPGQVRYDFGDLVRSAAFTVDGQFSPTYCAAIAEGFRRGVGSLLGAEERAALPRAPQLVGFELALRFLTDHLLGDGYFQVERPGQNLARGLRQLERVASLEAAAPIVGRIFTA